MLVAQLNHLRGVPDEEALREKVGKWIKEEFTLEQLPTMIEAIGSGDRFLVHFGCIGIRRIVSVENGIPIQPIIDANLVPKLIEFMKNDNEPHIQLEAAWILTNVASGTTEQTQCVVSKGGIPLFAKLLRSRHPEISEQAIWALGNISGDAIEYRDQILKHGAISLLSNLIHNSKYKHTIKSGTWALSNLCRGKPAPANKYTLEAIPTFCWVLMNSNELEVINDCVWAFCYLSEGSGERVTKIMESGVGARLIEILSAPNIAIVVPTLRTIGNLLTGKDKEADQLIQYGLIQRLNLLLGHERRAVVREACWTLSNITAGNERHINMALTPEILTKLNALATSDSPEVSREATWVICNSTSHGSPIQMKELMATGLLSLFKALLDPEEDLKRNSIILEALFNLLSCGEKHLATPNDPNPVATEMHNLGMVDTIENLQRHPSEDLYSKSLKILENFFELENPI